MKYKNKAKKLLKRQEDYDRMDKTKLQGRKRPGSFKK